ncbi:DUF4259 domain-containing protein [Arthrobacter sp. TWP1-1]|uniref:DUF4259 domain-containing protein n=1 Tax=Arthrobacter sp. TWP1-1 TaxID=2804568 RepID=UPI003CF21BF9
MGTWDASAFGNDDAADFLYEFDDADSVAKVVPILENALDTVLEATTEIESSEGAVGIAAAALVVAWNEPALLANLTSETLSPWPRNNELLPARLPAKASKVLDRMLSAEENELAELWEEAEELPEFTTELTRWRSRLA